MATIYITEAFDAENFERETIKSVDTISNHIVGHIIDDFTQGLEEGMSLENGTGGWVDAILYDLQEPVENPEHEIIRGTLIKTLSYLSEYNGRFTKEFGRDDPMFFGYLTPAELKELQNILEKLPSDIDKGYLLEFKEQLVGMAEVCKKSNLGILFSALP